MSTLSDPRRARRVFRGMLNEFIFVHEIWNKYSRNWGCCHVLQSIGGGIYYYYYFFMEASCDPALRCDAFFVNLNFHCIEHFIYTIVSFVLVCLYLSLHILLFLNAYPPPPPPLFLCVFNPACVPSMPQGGSNATYFLSKRFLFFFFYFLHLFFVFGVFTRI